MLRRIPQRWWSVALVSLYLLLVTFALARHVMWRDEAQMWLVGRASSSLADLLTNMQYENRPALWFLLTWPIARISGNPEAIKVVTWVAAAGSAYVVSRYLPLRRVEQIALLSGFLFLVGYSIISTGYMVGVLATLLWFVAYSRGSVVGQFVFAAVMSATHALFLLLAIPLWIFCAVQAARPWVERRTRVNWAYVVAALLTAVVIAWSAWLIVPPADYGFSGAAPVPLNEVPLRMVEYAGSAVRAPGIALPRLLTTVPLVIWALPVMVIAIASLLVGRWTAIAPVAGLVLVTANGVVGYGPFWWHSGVIVIAVLVIVLVTRAGSGSSPFSGAMLVQTLAWWAVLALQILVVVSVPGRFLWTGPAYSGAKAAAEAIRMACPSGCPLVTNDDVVGTAVSAYLSGEPAYTVDTRRMGTYTVWDAEHGKEGSVGWIDIADALIARGPSAVAFVSGMGEPPRGFTVIAEPTPSVWAEERFHVVRLGGGAQSG
jgi:hypothetical protein